MNTLTPWRSIKDFRLNKVEIIVGKAADVHRRHGITGGVSIQAIHSLDHRLLTAVTHLRDYLSSVKKKI